MAQFESNIHSESYQPRLEAAGQEIDRCRFRAHNKTPFSRNSPETQEWPQWVCLCCGTQSTCHGWLVLGGHMPGKSFPRLPVGRLVLLENRVNTQRATRQSKVLKERIYLQRQVDVEWKGLNAQSQPPARENSKDEA